MRWVIIIITALLLSGSAYAQYPSARPETRPQWNSYYNGRGVYPGYRYNPRSGWNTVTTPGGNWMHYRDGYTPMRPGRPRRYYPSYNNNSYLNTMEVLIYGNGW